MTLFLHGIGRHLKKKTSTLNKLRTRPIGFEHVTALSATFFKPRRRPDSLRCSVIGP